MKRKARSRKKKARNRKRREQSMRKERGHRRKDKRRCWGEQKQEDKLQELESPGAYKNIDPTSMIGVEEK